MTIQNNGTQSYTNITPIKAKFNDPEMSSQLFITSIVDNGFNSAEVFWEVRSAPQAAVFDSNQNLITPAKNGKTYHYGSVTMAGTDYTNWGSDDAYPFSILVSSLGLTAA